LARTQISLLIFQRLLKTAREIPLFLMIKTFTGLHLHRTFEKEQAGTGFRANPGNS
jgi:hypothetical protein